MSQVFDPSLPRARRARELLEQKRGGGIKSPITSPGILGARFGSGLIRPPAILPADASERIEHFKSDATRIAAGAADAVSGVLCAARTHTGAWLALQPAPAALLSLLFIGCVRFIGAMGKTSDMRWLLEKLPAALTSILAPAPAWYDVRGRFGTNHQWIESLEKPVFAAPCVVHRVMWMGLHLCMAAACYRLLTTTRARLSDKRLAIGMFAVQALRNAFWSFAVLGTRSTIIGSIFFAVSTALLIPTVRACAKVDRLAGRLMLPVLGWVGYTCLCMCAMAVMNH